MRVMIWSAQRRRQWLIFAACMALGALLLVFPQAAGTGVKRGLAVCGQLLIPSLFPFMVLSGFVIQSGLAGGIGRRLNPLMTRLFGLSGNAAVAVIASLLGGYPAGANAVAQLIEQGEIDAAEGRRLLRICVNAGPAFIIGGIGAGMLGSAQAGLLLLTAHIVSSLLVMLMEREPYTPLKVLRAPAVSIGTAVTNSVNATCSALLSMCGFVLLSSAALSLTDALGGAAFSRSILRCAFTCIIEVSTGCVEAAALGALAPFWIGAALGFGGLSVHGQIAARTAAHNLMTVGFFRTRLLHALLGGCLSFLLFHFFGPAPVDVPAVASLSAVTDSSDAVGFGGLLSLLLLCVLFLNTLPSRGKARL